MAAQSRADGSLRLWLRSLAHASESARWKTSLERLKTQDEWRTGWRQLCIEHSAQRTPSQWVEYTLRWTMPAGTAAKHCVKGAVLKLMPASRSSVMSTAEPRLALFLLLALRHPGAVRVWTAYLEHLRAQQPRGESRGDGKASFLQVLGAMVVSRLSDPAIPVVVQSSCEYGESDSAHPSTVPTIEFRRLSAFWSESKSALVALTVVLGYDSDAALCLEADLQWCSYLMRILFLRVRAQALSAWFSTLGGAYSALGETKRGFAQMAGEMALEQLRIALQLNDEGLAARCRIYYSYSLIQKGEFAPAGRIITAQKAVAARTRDEKLRIICLSAEHKLRYARLQGLRPAPPEAR